MVAPSRWWRRRPAFSILLLLRLRLVLWTTTTQAQAQGQRSEAYIRARKDGVWDADCERALQELRRRRRHDSVNPVSSQKKPPAKKLWDHPIDDTNVQRRGSGVLLAAAGDAEFLSREVAPASRHLGGLRASTEWPPDVRLALFAETGLLTSSSSTDVVQVVRSAYDLIIEETNPAAATVRAFRVKAFKIRAMARSPFTRTLYLDFDSRPCAPNFAADLLHRLDAPKPADLAIADNFADQAALSFSNDLRREHASGCVALRSDSEATRRFLRDYAAAHALLKHTQRGRRDQPALMVALRNQFLDDGGKNTLLEGQEDGGVSRPLGRALDADPSSPDYRLVEEEGRRSLRLAHLSASDFCRKNTSKGVPFRDASVRPLHSSH